MAAQKRDQYSLSIRLTQDEDAWMRQKAAKVGMDISDWVRRCVAIGSPVLDGNLFARRVELKDAMEADKGQ